MDFLSDDRLISKQSKEDAILAGMLEIPCTKRRM